MPRSVWSHAWGAGLGAAGLLLLVGWLAGPEAGAWTLCGGLAGWMVSGLVRRERAVSSRRHELEPRSSPIDTDDLLRRVQAGTQLQSARRLEALGQLTGGVAHDFNNLLTAIGTSTTLLRAELGPSGSQEEALELIALVEDASRRAASLTRRLLALGRSEDGPEEIDLEDFLVSFAELLRRTLGGGVDVVETFEASGARVRADRAALELALLNLAVNARDAMPNGGRLTLGSRRLDPQGWPDGRTDEPGVEIWVQDVGTGMSDEVRAQAFNPFFTTKPRGEGSGLGLGAVAEAVRSMGGTLELESALGRGTVVRMAIPVLRGSSLPVGDDRADAQLGGRVLVVAAEGPVRRSLIVQLTDLGLDTRAVTRPEEALERVKVDRFDAVVSTELASDPGSTPFDRVVRVVAPAVPVVLISDGPGAALPTVPGVAHLVAPVDPKTLRRCLLRALNPGLPLPSESEEARG